MPSHGQHEVPLVPPEKTEPVRKVVTGNDGVHEWGYTVYDNGLTVNWMDNLRAREELVAMMAAQIAARDEQPIAEVAMGVSVLTTR